MDILTQLGISWQLLVTQIIGFLILMVILHRVFTTKVFGILDERRKDIQDTYDQLDRDRAMMEQTRRDYEQRLANIEAEARERIQAAVKEAQALRDNLVADARTQAESIVEQGRNESERERQQAFLEMRQQIVAIAVAAAGKVIGESLNEPRQTKLVDDFITQVGFGAGAGTASGALVVGAGSNGAGGAKAV